MRFINPDNYHRWKDIDLARISGTAFWGGEPAANLLTGYLHPGTYTIYTDQSWHSFKEMSLSPMKTAKWKSSRCSGKWKLTRVSRLSWFMLNL
jgi:hypothetical protein